MRRAVLFSVLAAVGLMSAAPAQAQQLPAGCGGNESDFRIFRTPTTPARPGETVKFTVYAHNTGFVPCNIRLLTPLVFTLPGLDGTPTGPQTPLRPTGTDFLAGFPLTVLYETTWTVTVNPEVTDAVTEISGNSKLFDAAAAHDYRIYRTVGTDVTNPILKLDKIGSITSGVAPQNVTYTFKVTNDSRTPVPMNQVAVTDDKCGTPKPVGGDDVGNDGLLSNGETWTYTCAMLHQAPGVYTNTATACAVSTVDKRPVCSPPDTWTVTLTPPPVNPPPPSSPPAETAVKPANATQAPCTLSTPKGLKVRAGEVTTIKATVRQVDAGTLVKITVPGGKSVSAKTNSKGVAVLKVKPTKTGTARITVAECSDVERLTVRAARKTQSKRVPRVTG
jgi:hypothetical protein